MKTRTSPSSRVAVVLSMRDVLALDAAATAQDLTRSSFLRRLLRARLREDGALPAKVSA